MKVPESVKTVAWALPLTILIWIYAEREQVVNNKNGSFPLEVRMIDGNKIVNLKVPGDSNIVVTFSGPNNVVDQITRKHDKIQITLPPNTPIGDSTFNFLQFMVDYPPFASQGVSVVSVIPAEMKVEVDRLERMPVEVRAAPALRQNDPDPDSFRFTPKQVWVKAPSKIFQEAKDANKLYVIADTSGARDIIKVGENKLDGLQVSFPIRSDRVTIEQPTVSGLIEIKDGGSKITLDSVPVWLDIAPTVSDQYTVEFSKRTIPNVILAGPKELLTKVNVADSIPHFLLEVVSADIKSANQGKITRKLRFANLPDGVTITNSADEYTVTFSLNPR